MSKTIRREQESMSAAGMNANLETIANDASQVGIGVLIVLAALIGVWGVACLVGGIVNSEGILEMATGFVSAVTGK